MEGKCLVVSYKSCIARVGFEPYITRITRRAVFPVKLVLQHLLKLDDLAIQGLWADVSGLVLPHCQAEIKASSL